jgi:hypothetical protein
MTSLIQILALCALWVCFVAAALEIGAEWRNE